MSARDNTSKVAQFGDADKRDSKFALAATGRETLVQCCRIPLLQHYIQQSQLWSKVYQGLMIKLLFKVLIESEVNAVNENTVTMCVPIFTSQVTDVELQMKSHDPMESERAGRRGRALGKRATVKPMIRVHSQPVILQRTLLLPAKVAKVDEACKSPKYLGSTKSSCNTFLLV